MNKNESVPVDVELTTVVGNFLCWDETGGLYPTIAQGLKALPRLLETKRFHSNLLKADCETIFNKKIEPDFSDTTKTYLLNLYNGLSNNCVVTRVATMISFESHANIMINSLWKSISTWASLSESQLTYFLLHVGGDDPAEKYHVQMTRDLIEKTIPNNKYTEFLTKFLNAYQMHYQWCDDIIRISLKLPTAA